MRINKINFGKYKHLLWDSVYKNFIKDQPYRFELLEGKPIKTGSMYFCSTYLEAHFTMGIVGGVSLYKDECSPQTPFVVISKKRFR